MAGSFMQTASRQVLDVSTFLKEAADNNGIKYVAEQGKKHRVYIPPCTQEIEEDGVKKAVQSIIAISGKVHEWKDAAGKFYSTICLADVVRRDEQGNIINNGSCPFCDRVDDAWSIYNYRLEQEEANCNLTGENRKNHLDASKTTFADERKAKKPTNYMYMLVVKFKTNEDGSPQMSDKQLPLYELKVMKLSRSRVEKIQKQLLNSGVGFAGSEVIFDYPNTEDKRLQISQSTVSPVFGDALFMNKYPALKEQIDADVQKFTWDGVDEAFKEWKGMTQAKADETVGELFSKWDEYKEAKLINPLAKYAEYASDLQVNNPSLGVPQIPNVPQINATSQPIVPGIAQAETPVVPNVPNVPVQPQVEQNVQATQAVAQGEVAATANSILGGVSVPTI